MSSSANQRHASVGEAFRLPARRLLTLPRPIRKQNRLPLESYQEPGAYSLSLVTHDRKEAFSDDEVVRECLGILRAESKAHSFAVFAYCFMPDHLHLLMGSEDRCDVPRFVKAFKQNTGYWYKHRAPAEGLSASPTVGSPLWQRSFHNHVVRSDEALRSLANYVFDNPVVAELAEDQKHYRWSRSLVWEDPF